MDGNVTTALDKTPEAEKKEDKQEDKHAQPSDDGKTCR